MINEAVLMKKPDSKTVFRRRLNKIFIHAVLCIFVLIILLPFYIIVISSIKSDFEGMNPEFSWWPKLGITIQSYKNVFKVVSYRPSIIKGFFNTLWVVLPPTLLGLLSSSLSAYAFAKIKFRAKNIMFTFLIMTMMIPGIITLTPTYFIYQNIGWVRTPLPLMIPGMFGAAACVFFMRQFFSSIPDALVESAKIDGLNYVGIFFKIMIPLSGPALIAQGVLGFLGGYNDYFGPLLYLTGAPKLHTLQIALATFADSWKSLSIPTLMAGAVVALVPTLLLYIFAQRFFIEGISTSGMKL